MPQLGDTTVRNKVGLRGGSRMIWAACPECQKERWVMKNLYDKRGGSVSCQSCTGKRTHIIAARSPKPKQSERQRGAGNHRWKDGTMMHKSGYRYIFVPQDDPLYCMANGN